MPTKEEIWYKQTGSKNLTYTDDALEAMDEYAKQESIAFIDWAVKNHSVDYEGFSFPVWVGGEEYNPSDLYTLFINRKIK